MENVSLIGFEIFDSFERKKMEDKIAGLLGKFDTHFGGENLDNVKIIYRTLGSKDDHTGEVRFTMETDIGVFRSKKVGHKVLETIDEIVNDVGKQISKKKEKMKTFEKPRNA